jgi:hypothetical protein
MPTKINNDSMSLEIDGHVIASAECRDHAATETWTSRLTPAACSPGTRLRWWRRRRHRLVLIELIPAHGLGNLSPYLKGTVTGPGRGW